MNSTFSERPLKKKKKLDDGKQMQRCTETSRGSSGNPVEEEESETGVKDIARKPSQDHKD